MVTKKSKRMLSILALVLILVMVLGTVAGALMGCGKVDEASQETEAVSQETEAQTDTKEEKPEDAQSEAADKEAEEPKAADDAKVRVAGLKGATTIGLVNLIDKAAKGEAPIDMEYTMYTQGSDIMAAMVSGSIDIGLVPSNVAAVMNNKVEGGVSVIDINTLGVLYCVAADEGINEMKDLAGKTLYMTGQGATPEYTVRHLLKANSIEDCNIEFKSEPAEIVSLFENDSQAVAVLPQPFVTAALMQNDKLNIRFSLDDEWEKAGAEGRIVTGVTVVSNSFLKEHQSLVDEFISAQASSVVEAVSDVDKTAALVVEQGIIAKEPLAKKAIPYCNIVCLSGSEMKEYLEGYYKVLFEEDPKSVGGALPSDDFYYGID